MSKQNHLGFSLNLQSLMREKALSQGDLARLVGVSTATVWGWIHESIPQRRTAEVLCQKLDVSRRWLIAGIGEREEYFKSGHTPLSADLHLSLLEYFDKVDTVVRENATEERVYKLVITQLRKLADSFDKRGLRPASSAVRKLAASYERKFPTSSNTKIAELTKELKRRRRGAKAS